MYDNENWDWEIDYETWNNAMKEIVEDQLRMRKYYLKRIENAKSKEEKMFYLQKVQSMNEMIEYNLELMERAKNNKDKTIFCINNQGQPVARFVTKWYKRYYDEKKKESKRAYI